MRAVPKMIALLPVLWAPLPLMALQAVSDSGREARYEALLSGVAVPGPVASITYPTDHRTMLYSVREADSLATYSLDLATGAVRPLFDSRLLRARLAAALGRPLDGAGTPFRRFRALGDRPGRIGFAMDGSDWALDLDSYEVRPLPGRPGPGTGATPAVLRPGEFGRPDLREVPAPDGAVMATLVGHGVALRTVDTGVTERISFDGEPDRFWGYLGIARRRWAWWSADSERLALRKVDMSGVDPFFFVRWLDGPARAEWRRGVHNVRVGARLPREELHVWHRETGRLVPMDVGDPEDAFLYVLGWRPRGDELIVLRITRDYRDLRVMALDPSTGEARDVVSETFVTCWTEPAWAPPLRRYWPLADGQRFLWKADDGGWDHLFLRDYHGNVLAQLTAGPFPVDDVIGVDEARGWVYFSARTDRERPYDVHVHRVRLDGTGMARLTNGEGRHAAELVADSEYLEVWRRRVDGPTELQIRRADGELVRTVAAADLSELVAAGWTPPEEFTVKAADDVTDLHGVLYKPADFDPSKRYPVVEFIYGGPILEHVPRQIPYPMFPHALAQLGYIVVKLDARGTPGRGTDFLEAGWDRPSVVVADHAGAIRALARERAYMDLDRVAMVGQSWGAKFTTRALLLEPDLYRVGVAVSGGWWNGPARSQPKATVFEQCAVLRDAEPAVPSLDPFTGDLLVIHGTADLNVSGSSDLMGWLDMVVDAGKYVDLLILPDRPHDLLQTDAYVHGAIRRYLRQHLEPRR